MLCNFISFFSSVLLRLTSYEQDLKAIGDLRDEYVEALEDFIDLCVGGGEVASWREEILGTERKVREHALAIRGQAVLLTRKLGLEDRAGGGEGRPAGHNLCGVISR